MNIVYVVEAVYNDGYDHDSWIMSMFDSEQKAIAAIDHYYLQDGVNFSDCAEEDKHYRIKKWEVM